MNVLNKFFKKTLLFDKNIPKTFAYSTKILFFIENNSKVA